MKNLLKLYVLICLAFFSFNGSTADWLIREGAPILQGTNLFWENGTRAGGMWEQDVDCTLLDVSVFNRDQAGTSRVALYSNTTAIYNGLTLVEDLGEQDAAIAPNFGDYTRYTSSSNPTLTAGLFYTILEKHKDAEGFINIGATSTTLSGTYRTSVVAVNGYGSWNDGTLDADTTVGFPTNPANRDNKTTGTYAFSYMRCTPTQTIDYANPNEPSGFSESTDNPADTLPGTGWSMTDALSYTSQITFTSPKGDNEVIRWKYPAAMVSGTSSGKYTHELLGDSHFPQVYLSTIRKRSSGWEANDSGIQKEKYAVDQTEGGGGGNPTFLSCNTGEDYGNEGYCNFAAHRQGSVGSKNWNIWGSVADETAVDVLVPHGEWYMSEVHLLMNTPSVADGSLHIWINGVKIIEDLAVEWEDGTTPNWSQFNHDPIWGGAGDPVVTEFYLYIDHLYASVCETNDCERHSSPIQPQ